MEDGTPSRAITEELILAFTRLARGDFSVRLARNYRRDTEDTLASFVNLLAEELDRLFTERERAHAEAERSIATLSEVMVALASGDFSARAPRTERGDPMDVLAYMLNNMAAEVGEAVTEIHRQRGVLETILESMLDGVVFLDQRGLVQRTNRAFVAMLARPAGEIVGRPFGDLLDAREGDLGDRILDLVRVGHLRDRRTLFRAAAGPPIALGVSASGQRSADGVLEGAVIVVRDDRELRAMQAQLQVADRLATMGTVAAGVAHEINNPLAFVMSNLDYIDEELQELAEKGTLEPDRLDEVVKALRSTRGGADRVAQIVRDLKAFSRTDQDATTRVDVSKLCEAAFGFVRSEIRHRARLVKEYGDAPAVEANEGRLVQVFLNLIQNAAQAIPAGDVDRNEIRVVTGTTAQGEAFVEVHDTGSGIPEEHLVRIFDLFFTTKPVGVGTGLGLAICHRIIDQLGGAIDVQSEVGKGTMFRVRLPAATGEPRSLRAPKIEAPRPPPARRRILVLDDEVEIGEAAQRILGRDHEVVHVTRGAEALRLLTERRYDLVLCDLLMPEMTGMQFFERLKAERPEATARVVFMSGASSHPEAREYLATVPNARIEKPFDAKALRAVVEREARAE